MTDSQWPLGIASTPEPEGPPHCEMDRVPVAIYTGEKMLAIGDEVFIVGKYGSPRRAFITGFVPEFNTRGGTVKFFYQTEHQRNYLNKLKQRGIK